MEEAADFLNLAKQTLYGMTSRKDIAFLKKSRKIYFRRSDLEAFLAEGRQKTRSEIKAEAQQFIETQKEKRAAK